MPPSAIVTSKDEVVINYLLNHPEGARFGELILRFPNHKNTLVHSLKKLVAIGILHKHDAQPIRRRCWEKTQWNQSAMTYHIHEEELQPSVYPLKHQTTEDTLSARVEHIHNDTSLVIGNIVQEM